MRLLSSLLFTCAGAGLFMVLFNRVLIMMKDGPVKSVTIHLCFGLLVPAFAFLGYFLGWAWWVVPAALLLGLAVGEVRRKVIRSRLEADPPVKIERTNEQKRRFLTTETLSVVRYNWHPSRWTGPRFRIAVASDLHLRDRIPEDHFARAMEKMNEARADLVFFTGDYIVDQGFCPYLRELLGSVRARLGVFAVLGNHDYWIAGQEVAAAVRSAGITLLDNGGSIVSIDEDHHVLINGCDDPWGSKPWQPPDTSELFTLALSHTPDNIYRLSRAGVDGVFSGHLHAGQMRVPGMGALVMPSVFGRRFDGGHFKVNKTDLFITAGVGAVGPALRLFCEPDILVVDVEPSIPAGPAIEAAPRRT